MKKHISKEQAAQQTQTETVRPPEPTPEQIGKRAHEIFLARGCVDGCDLDDWLQAERELKAGKDSSAAV
jgi:hypothetical protein